MANSFLRGCGNIARITSAAPIDPDIAELYETFLGAAITEEIHSLVVYIAYFHGHISMVLHNRYAYRICFDSSPLTPYPLLCSRYGFASIHALARLITYLSVSSLVLNRSANPPIVCERRRPSLHHVIFT